MIVFDLETQYLAGEVGGGANVEALRLAVACSWDERHGYRTWWESQAAELVSALGRAERPVGYGISRFDLRVLALYGDVSGLAGRSFDMMEHIWQQTGRRVSLKRLAEINLGESKLLAGGVEAVRLWRAGRLATLEAYCRRDVELTRRLYEFWQAQGVLFINAAEYVAWPGGVTPSERGA